MALVEIATIEEVAPLLRSLDSPKADRDGLYPIEPIMRNGQCWKVTENGVITGALVTIEDGRELWVTLAAGRSDADLTEIMAQHLERTAAGRFDSIGFQTERRGLVRKTQRHGFELAGYIVRKRLKK